MTVGTRDTFVTALALFSLFFGAGNLILPPLLGLKAGELWWSVALGFCISAVCIPIMGILAHAKLQGTIFDFGKKVSPVFSMVYSFLVYAISVSLPSPRTAAVAHEMAIQPFFEVSSLTTSLFYFALVFLFVINRSKLLDVLGKLLTPAIILILVIIVGAALFADRLYFGDVVSASPLTEGILEGYQTFDAIGAVVVGGVIIVSINLKNKNIPYADKNKLIRRAGLLAGLGLFLMYTGLILTGALMHEKFDSEVTRTALLNGVSQEILGSTGKLFLSVLVALACFTTAVGIVTGTADFVKSRCKDSQLAYIITAVIGCLIGVAVGQLNVEYIIAIALPALMFIYPITIVLIFLNVIPGRYASPQVFRTVVLTTLVFSIPDFMESAGAPASYTDIFSGIPLRQYSLGWLLPAMLVFVGANMILIYSKVKERVH